MLLLAACTRENGAFDTGEGGGSAGEDGEPNDADGPEPGTSSASGSASGSGVDGNTTEEEPTTVGTTEATTMPLEGTSTTGVGEEEGSMTSTTTGGPPPDSCCDPFMPCGNTEVSGCACDVDAECCEPSWGLYCVALAMSEECLAAECLLPMHGCCDGFGAPGCNDAGVMACVCATSPTCCTVAWEAGCVEAAMKCPESPCA